MFSAPAALSSSNGEAETWDIKIRKRMISPERVEEVRARLGIMASAFGSASDTAYVVPFEEVVVSPLYLTLRADKSLCEAALGDRSSYTLLPRGVDERAAIRLLRYICVAVASIHSCGITHSHLSQGNIVWNEQRGQVVLLGHLLPISLFTPTSPLGVVSRRLAAPEILRSEPYDTAADVWSIGVLFLEMMLPEGKSFETADVEDTDLLSPLLATVSATGRSFLLQCLKSDPSRRPTMADLLQHPLFTSADNSMDNSDDESEGDDESEDDDESEGDDEEETEDDRSTECSSSGTDRKDSKRFRDAASLNGDVKW